MLTKEKTARVSNGKIEKQAVCLKKGGGRYFLIHRLSQMKKRNPNKEIQNRMKEIDRLMLYSV